MLAEIAIDNLGVISSASARFHPGLTVVTGETGAGKTMVVSSLHLLSGARADADRVREGAQRAVVEGRFFTRGVDAALALHMDEVLESAGAQRDDDGSIIAVRTVGVDGRSRAHLGGRSVPAAVLTALTGPLLTVHGQNDQLRLVRGDQQLAALDKFGDSEIGGLLGEYRRLRREWLAARAELLERTTRARELAQEADRLSFALTEIDAIAPMPGEDEAIVADVRRLTDLDSLRSGAAQAQSALRGADGDAESSSALDLLGQACGQLEAATDPALAGLAESLREAIVIASDVAGELAAYLEDLPADPEALGRVLFRQGELKGLTRKYAADVDGVLAWADDARARLAGIDVSAESLAELEARADELGKLTAEAAAALTAARVGVAAELASAVTGELAGLAMSGMSFEVVVADRVAGPGDDAPLTVGSAVLQAGPAGVDDVEFRLRHGGSKPLPLAKSASGGELSRIMLAMEVVLADADSGATMVFDEVDAGVGGRAAVEIGRRLARLARTHQVIVVTHLPQVAAYADQHLLVQPEHEDDPEWQRASGVRVLDQRERVAELARMLAGLGDSETGRAHAEELLAKATADKAR